jgi:hypothetical protein
VSNERSIWENGIRGLWLMMRAFVGNVWAALGGSIVSLPSMYAERYEY